MLKTKLFSITLLVFIGSTDFCLANPAREKSHDTKWKTSSKATEFGSVVRVTSNIKKGDIFTKANIEEYRCQKSKILDSNGIGLCKFVIGKRAARDLHKSQQISLNDVKPYPTGDFRSLVYTLKDIPANACIQKGDVKLMQAEYFTKFEPLKPLGPTSYEAVIGKKTRKNLPKEHRIINEDLLH